MKERDVHNKFNFQKLKRNRMRTQFFIFWFSKLNLITTAASMYEFSYQNSQARNFILKI